jgi:hypothetical protein
VKENTKHVQFEENKKFNNASGAGGNNRKVSSASGNNKEETNMYEGLIGNNVNDDYDDEDDYGDSGGEGSGMDNESSRMFDENGEPRSKFHYF